MALETDIKVLGRRDTVDGDVVLLDEYFKETIIPAEVWEFGSNTPEHVVIKYEHGIPCSVEASPLDC